MFQSTTSQCSEKYLTIKELEEVLQEISSLSGNLDAGHL